MKWGAITVQTVLIIASPVLAIAGGYWANARSTDGKIHEVQTSLSADISVDRQRISSLEADNKAMKEWLTRIEVKLDKAIAQ